MFVEHKVKISVYFTKKKKKEVIHLLDISLGWLFGCLGFNGPLRQYFSLYQAVSQREGELGEKG